MLVEATGVLGLGAKAMGSWNLGASVLERMGIAIGGRHLRC